MNKTEFEKIFTLENYNTEQKDFIELYEKIKTLIKNNESHSEERYVNDIFYDFSRNRFEVEIFITEDDDAENGEWNESDPDTIYYDIKDTLELLK